MRKIKLSNGQVALVDNEDFYLLSHLGSWQISTKGYAHMKKWNGKKYQSLNMARVVMGLKIFDKNKVDHKNLNKLDNRRNNLRICDDTLNNLNVAKRRGNYTSKYKGVHKKINRWRVAITLNGKKRNIGSFVNEKDAARAYNKEARKLFGEFAYLNHV